MGGSDSRNLDPRNPAAALFTRGGALALFRAYGNAAAFADDLGPLPYSALADRVAAASRKLGAIGENRFVVVRCGRPRDALAQILAVWSSGNVAVPLEENLSAVALQRILQRIMPAAVFHRANVELLDRPREVKEPASLLLFTSGSSGEPKGVLLGAAGLAHNVSAIADYLPIREAERVGLCSPLFYSYGLIGQAMTTWAAGATLFDLQGTAFPQEQLSRIRYFGIRGISSVPTHLRKLANALKDKNETISLRFCGVAGAALDADTYRLLSERFPDCEFFHQYGLTEASPRVTAISNRDPAFHRSVGKALPGIQLRIHDEQQRELAVGEEGLVYVNSPSRMLGYLDDQESTSRVLDENGWLKTGDRGSLDSEGNLSVTGRADGVVKCAGERVGLESVASVIRSLDGIADAGVVAIAHPELGSALVAFVEPEVDVSALRIAIRDRLSPAQRPQRVVALRFLPRTQTGKVALGELQKLAESG